MPEKLSDRSRLDCENPSAFRRARAWKPVGSVEAVSSLRVVGRASASSTTTYQRLRSGQMIAFLGRHAGRLTMLDRAASRLLFASVAILVLGHSAAGAATISWGVRVDTEAAAVDESGQGPISETVGAQRGDAFSTLTQQGDAFNGEHSFALSLAAASLRPSTLRVRADTINSASAAAKAHYEDTLTLKALFDD